MMSLTTIKLRLRDKHAAELNRQARAVNYVWNYCNEMQQKAARSGRKWLTATELQRLTAGSCKLLGLHANTICVVCQQYEQSRKQRRKAWLRFRGTKSLGWVPFGHSRHGITIVAPRKVKFRSRIYETMHWRTHLATNGLVHTGSFNQDARGRWYVNIPVEVPDDFYATASRGVVGIDLGLRDIATLSTGDKVENLQIGRASCRERV